MSRFTRKNHGSSHSYYVDGIKIPGVTSILGVLDKPALVEWAAKTTARHAIENWERLSGMNPIDRYEELRGSRRSVNKEATVRGTKVHALADQLARGQTISSDDQSLIAAATVYAELLDRWELEPLHLEASVVNWDYQYGGTMDGIFTSPRLGTLIVDVKTGKRAYDEVALQLAAYRNADVYLREIPQFGPRGGKLKSLWEEVPMPAVDGAAVIWIERETDESPAAAHLLPVDAGPEVFDQFLYLREIYAGWIERTDWDNRKAPTYNPPIGAELFPEMTDDEIREAIES